MSGSTINFTTLPANTIRIPGFFFQLDPTPANTGQIEFRTLIIGKPHNPSPVASGDLGQLFIAGSVSDIQAQCGYGSMLSLMYQAYRQTDPFGEVWMLWLGDTGTVTPATIALSGTATAAGTLCLYIGGALVAVSVNDGDTAATVATNLAAAINSGNPELPVTATTSSATVTLDSSFLSECVEEIDLRLNYLGSLGNQSTPAGITVTITAFAYTGSESSELGSALSTIVNKQFDVVICPLNDSSSLAVMQSYLSDTSGTWSWESELFGHCVTALRGTFGNLVTFGESQNNQHVTVKGFYDSPTPAWIWAANLGGGMAASASADPAVPLTDIPLNVLAPPEASQFSASERNSLLYSGISTFTVNQAGQVITDRIITTYQTNATGAADDSYLGAETMFQLSAYLQQLRDFLLTNFSRKVLVQNGNNAPVGSSLVTPAVIQAAIVANYNQLCIDGEMQNPTQFAQLIQLQDAGNGQVRMYLPIELAGQLFQLAALVAFSKP